MKKVNSFKLFEQVKNNLLPGYKEHVLEVTEGDFNKCWNCGIESDEVYFVSTLNPETGNEYALLLCPECYDRLKKVFRIILYQDVVELED